MKEEFTLEDIKIVRQGENFGLNIIMYRENEENRSIERLEIPFADIDIRLNGSFVVERSATQTSLISFRVSSGRLVGVCKELDVVDKRKKVDIQTITQKLGKKIEVVSSHEEVKYDV